MFFLSEEVHQNLEDEKNPSGFFEFLLEFSDLDELKEDNLPAFALHAGTF